MKFLVSEAGVLCNWKVHVYFLQIYFCKLENGVWSSTTMSIKAYLMAILDNYMFRPLLANFRLSSRELNLRSYYIY